LINTGTVQANNLLLAHDSTLTLHPGDVVNSQISLANASNLSVLQADGQLTGLTLNSTSASSLSLLDTSVMALSMGHDSLPNWIFRWQDPTGGNWVTTLNNDILAGRITVSAPNGYSVIDQACYTYIEGGFVNAVPEPSPILLAGLAGFLTLAGRRLARRRASR
jgi:hypothetical protein